MLKGKILITGGTGSLGTAILDRAQREGWDAEFTILARGETRMSQVLKKYPHVTGKVGDVRDLEWLETIFPGHDYVIHAAAIKQVPTAESNVREAILTNVIGSMNVCTASAKVGIPRTVMISTDKAVSSSTQYGAGKFMMEGVAREANHWSGRSEFVIVRYGNVLRSNASVVPLFERQMREDVPFTVTQKSMTRFWLSMQEAIDLVIAALNYADPGVTFVPKPKATTMEELAHYLDPEREIVEMGIRPGEKVHEQLIAGGESLHTSEGKKYFKIYPPTATVINAMPAGFEYSSETCERMTKEELFQRLNAYNPYEGPVYA